MSNPAGPERRDAFPPEFAELLAEVIELSMRAAVAPDPLGYLDRAADADTPAPGASRTEAEATTADPVLIAAARWKAVRARVTRELASHVLEAYGRLRRAEDEILRTAVAAQRRAALAATRH